MLLETGCSARTPSGQERSQAGTDIDAPGGEVADFAPEGAVRARASWQMGEDELLPACHDLSVEKEPVPSPLLGGREAAPDGPGHCEVGCTEFSGHLGVFRVVSQDDGHETIRLGCMGPQPGIGASRGGTIPV